MKRTNIYLDEEQARVLRHLAVEEGRSFTAVVREALSNYLAQRTNVPTTRVTGPRRSMPYEEWKSSFMDIVSRIRANTPPDMTPDEIEAEITLAREEVRRERAERRVTSPPAV